MAQPYCTGAVHVWVAKQIPPSPAKGPTPAAAGTPLYLGTCESAPDRQTDRAYKEIRNDLSSQKPFDYIYAGGEEAVISLVLTRWNEAVAQSLELPPLGGTIGTCSLNDIGTIMGLEGRAYTLWLSFQFAGRATMFGQEVGRRYLQCLFWGPDRDETGTKERKKHMVFRAFKQYNASTQTFTLFDFTMTGVGTPD